MQGRLTGKQHPDTSTVTYAYETMLDQLASTIRHRRGKPGQDLTARPRTPGFEQNCLHRRCQRRAHAGFTGVPVLFLAKP